MAFWKRLRLTLEMIKFEHSVFALPFALTGALLASREIQLAGRLLAVKLAWIVVAMVGARSAAMAFNRILDRRHRLAQSPHQDAPPAGRNPVAALCLGLRRGIGAGLPPGRARPQSTLLQAGAAGPGAWFSSIPSPSALPRSHTWSWVSRSESPRPRPGSRSPDRWIPESSGSPPRSPSGPPASTSSIRARITNSM